MYPTYNCPAWVELADQPQGGTQAGAILLRDNDGTTTTISLQGSSGFVQLGSPDEDGDLRLWDNNPDDEFSINLNGATGNVTGSGQVLPFIQRVGFCGSPRFAR